MTLIGKFLIHSLIVVLTFFTITVGTTWALTVSIVNPGFEADQKTDAWGTRISGGESHGYWLAGTISGWTLSGSSAGTWLPSADKLTDGAPEGNNVAYSNGATISQILAATLQPQTRYSLLADIGWRSDFDVFPGYRIELWAGETILGSQDAGPLQKDGFITSSLIFTSSETDALLGENLSIHLINTGGSAQVNFDDIRLDATPVPEPSTMVLLGCGLVSLAWFRGRRRKF